LAIVVDMVPAATCRMEPAMAPMAPRRRRVSSRVGCRSTCIRATFLNCDSPLREWPEPRRKEHSPAGGCRGRCGGGYLRVGALMSRSAGPGDEADRSPRVVADQAVVEGVQFFVGVEVERQGAAAGPVPL